MVNNQTAKVKSPSTPVAIEIKQMSKKLPFRNFVMGILLGLGFIAWGIAMGLNDFVLVNGSHSLQGYAYLFCCDAFIIYIGIRVALFIILLRMKKPQLITHIIEAESYKVLRDDAKLNKQEADLKRYNPYIG